MKLSSRVLSLILCASMLTLLSSCSKSSSSSNSSSSSGPADLNSIKGYSEDTKSLTYDNAKWNYDKTNNVYWRINVSYCTKPAATAYETMGIYVPGEYMTGTVNSDGTYTCKINTSGKVSSYTAQTAPIVFSINTPAYAPQAAPTSYNYNNVSSYLKAGLIYVCSGMRGKDSGYDTSGNLTFSGGAPWGVTDLKSAIRYYRFNKSVLPGNTDSIFTFGMSGGGAQSSLVGATGDSKLYLPYLESIGSAMYDASGKYISDATCGAMCWCPITSLDYANEAYEWNMGQYFSTGTRASTTFTSALSKDLAAAFPAYINKLGLKDQNGKVLTLSESSTGIYASGSYYDYLVSEIQTSLNNFLSDTKFPYTESSVGKGGRQGGAPNGQRPEGGTPPSGQKPEGGTPPSGEKPEGGNPQAPAANATPKTYNTVEDYIKSLNSDTEWVQYDANTNTAKITSMQAFVTHCKNASKSVGAFDGLTLGNPENIVFGNGESKVAALHFDSTMANLLTQNESKYSKYSDWKSSYATDFTSQLKEVDKFGNDQQTRLNMYNPMYFFSSYYAGYKSSNVAANWRIRTGINQSDTALTVETNLYLALKSYSGVKNVDFETVWGQAHVEAERTGNSTDNFIAWVNQCVSK